MVSFEDFKKLEIRIARIKEASDHPSADKLYVLTVDLGGRTKQIVAGIKNSYKKEDLVGRQIVMIDNLEPVTLRGVESQGMLLAASDDKGICLITPDRDAAPGSVVK